MYSFLVIALAFLALFCEKKLRFKSHVVTAFSLLLLVVFIGLRFELGTDWELIYYNFNRLTSGEDFGWMANPLYNLLSLISFYAGFSLHGVNVACALIFSAGLYSLLFRLSRPWLALCVFYPYYILVFSFNFDRQSAALGLAMLGISQLLHSRRIRYILCLLLGALFHPTVLILLPLLFATESVTRKSYILFIFASFFLLLVSMPLYFWLLSGNILSLSYNFFDAGYVYKSQGVWLRLLPLLFSAGLILSCRRRLKLTKFQFSIYALMAFMVIFLAIAAVPLSGVSTVIDRLSAYTSPLLLFAASESPNVLKNNGVPSSWVVCLISAYSVAMTIAWLTFSFYGSTYWIPYQNILFN